MDDLPLPPQNPVIGKLSHRLSAPEPAHLTCLWKQSFIVVFLFRWCAERYAVDFEVWLSVYCWFHEIGSQLCSFFIVLRLDQVNLIWFELGYWYGIYVLIRFGQNYKLKRNSSYYLACVHFLVESLCLYRFFCVGVFTELFSDDNELSLC